MIRVPTPLLLLAANACSMVCNQIALPTHSHARNSSYKPTTQHANNPPPASLVPTPVYLLYPQPCARTNSPTPTTYSASCEPHTLDRARSTALLPHLLAQAPLAPHLLAVHLKPRPTFYYALTVSDVAIFSSVM